MRCDEPGRAVFVALNQERTSQGCCEARWPALALFTDGACAGEAENSQYLDDWPGDFVNTIPGPGIWIWTGMLGWTSGEDADRIAEGSWRRPNAAEAWRLMRGESPLAATDPAGIGAPGGGS